MSTEEIFQLKDKTLIYIPFHKITNGFSEDNPTNYFHLNRKKTYCNLSKHIVTVCNQVVDKNPDLIVNYLKLKLHIKVNEDMTLDEFIDILYSDLIDPAEETISDIIESEYNLNLNEEIESKKIKNVSLIYRDIHCKLLLKISYMMKFTIPIMMEFAYVKLSPKEKPNDFILAVYDRLFSYFQKDLEQAINLDNKLIESIKSRIIITKYSDQVMWNFLEHNGRNANSFIYEQVKKLKTDIVPKYEIDQSIINLNLAFASHSVDHLFRTNFPVTYKTIDMSEKSEEDEVNKFERIEINSAKTNEDLNILHRIIIKNTIRTLRKEYNIQISKEEFMFYYKNLRIDKLKTNLTSLFFARYLGSCSTLYKSSRKEFIMFILIMKKILIQKNCKYIPLILTGHVDHAIKEKRVVSKKYLIKIIEDERYKKILDYNYNAADNIFKKQLIIERIIATLISTNFQEVEYYNTQQYDEDGNPIENEIVVKEFELIDEIIKFLEMI